MVEVRADKGGAVLSVKVAPRASRDGLAGETGGALKVRLTAPPVDGAANAALTAFLAKKLKVAKRDVDIVSGHRSKLKKVRVEGLAPAELIKRLGL